MNSITIRPFEGADWPQCWRIIHCVLSRGDTYPYPDTTSEDEARSIWLEGKTGVFVAVDDNSGALLGTYYLKPNQPGRGSHVCNCGYMVAEGARGRGLATAMCVHSQETALEAGFLAMQFNFVVASNDGAVRLWKKMGFEIIGTLPGAFDHPELGFVDSHVMFKRLA